MRAVLVTGAEGQLGRELCRLAPPGYQVVGVSHRELDITCRRDVDEAIDRLAPAWVINAAAYTAVDAAEDDPDTAYAVNRDGPAHLAAAARRTGGRMAHVSTDFVFDGESWQPYRPDDWPNPLGVYGASKLAGEHAVRDALGEDAVVLRTAWVYAATGRNFVHSMLRLMRERDELAVVADQIGTPTSAAALARGIWRAVEVGATGMLHWTDAGVASWYDFAVAIKEEALAVGLLQRDVSVRPITTAEFPTRATRPAFSVLDKTATWEALGMRAEHWRVALREVLATVPR